ncbi:hypothetical protein C8A05DRAFT_48197 [Staphylotrichum tortipilum]|uniref:Uncharacterized protein n=1 Tax=Staphylotrichum tortipilum TaxID=2831512 RepID=A0AAN6RP49_9PEZI|nr:hypothetical protein C8A05DRAFT_48197 [Staphylotrichum longicolle]
MATSLKGGVGGRWVYEGGGQAARGARAGSAGNSPCGVGFRAPARSRALLRDGKSAPLPSGPCAPLRSGRQRPGTSPRRPSQAVGSPISYVAALAWCPTVRRGARAARHLGRLRTGVREYPVCAEGWAMWVLGGSPDLSQSHRGYLPAGEADWLNLQVGPPLGAPRRRLRGAEAPDPASRRRSGECSGGKRIARRPSNLVYSTALKHGRQALAGAR